MIAAMISKHYGFEVDADAAAVPQPTASAADNSAAWHVDALDGRWTQARKKLVTHAVVGAATDNYSRRPAMCGVKPGRTSCGWVGRMPQGVEVTCPRCRKKLGLN
jgi:hypothetical protein